MEDKIIGGCNRTNYSRGLNRQNESMKIQHLVHDTYAMMLLSYFLKNNEKLKT
jgi:hypothetical protein